LGNWRTPVENPHNEPYRVPMMIYNPRINNPEKRKVDGNFYSLSIPTTILDIMMHTNSFSQKRQQDLALRFAANYEYAQSLLRPIRETIRFFGVDPGGGQWVLDNGRNLRVSRPPSHSGCNLTRCSASLIYWIIWYDWWITLRTQLRRVLGNHGVG
jgi:arylsulfatase A-like enzyme